MSSGGRCTARAEINVIGGKHSVIIADRGVTTTCRDGTGEICPTGGGRYVIVLLEPATHGGLRTIAIGGHHRALSRWSRRGALAMMA
jgi:hypothetical protein